MQLESDLADVRNALHDRMEELKEANDRIDKLRNDISLMGAAGKEAREKIDALKRMLTTAGVEAARTAGYLDRVHEDDHARDGFFDDCRVPVNNAPPVPRRRHGAGPQHYGDLGQADYDSGPGRVTTDARVERPSGAMRPETWRDKHWTQW